MVLDRLAFLRLVTGRAFVPEEVGFVSEHGVDQAHGMAPGLATLDARTDDPGIAEAERLEVTRGARDGARGRQRGVIEQDPAQGRAGIGDRIAPIIDLGDVIGNRLASIIVESLEIDRTAKDGRDRALINRDADRECVADAFARRISRGAGHGHVAIGIRDAGNHIA